MYVSLNMSNQRLFFEFVFQIYIQIDIIEIKILAIINFSYFDKINRLTNNNIKIQNIKLLFVYQ